MTITTQAPPHRATGSRGPGVLLQMATAALLAGLLALPLVAAAADTPVRSRGQRIYVPAYSHILIGDYSTPFNLAATLSVRNTDPAHAATVTAIDYYDGSGRLVKRHLERPHVLRPLASTEVFVPERDTSGGFGASFLVTWTAEAAITPPVVECLLIGARSGQGISILSPGRVIEQRP
ncbi:MAG: DUF3124 domain-containing protein [Desulfobacterales bacterium]|nr:DUF3124 domain-containing protein [Desulfobacterales bacterium]